MAKVFSPPQELETDTPTLFNQARDEDGRIDFDKLQELENEWLDKLREWCLSHTDSNSDLVGESFYIPWADGAAHYVVFRTQPLQLIHVPLGDAWHVPEYMTRGITGKDIRAQVETERKIRERTK